MSIMNILALLHNANEYVQSAWAYCKEWLREQLGPSTNTEYLIFDNDTVIPSGMAHCKYAHVSQYSQQEQRILAASGAPAALKRLPWISVQHKIGDHVVDISDWLAGIRTNTAVSLVAIVRLASVVLNMHRPEREHAKVVVIQRATGDEEEYVYHGKTTLLRRIEPTPVRHRPTCIEDGLLPDNTGLPIF